MRLLPNPTSFVACYPGWAQDVAKMIANDKTQATFGIFGRWGSGKSSACLAIQQALNQLSTVPGRYIGVIPIDLMDVQRGAIREKVQKQTADRLLVDRQGPKFSQSTVKKIVTYAKSFIGISAAGAASSYDVDGDVATYAAAEFSNSMAMCLEAGLNQYTVDEGGDIAQDLVAGDKIVIFFDDIDRCYPDVAIQLLATIGEFFHTIAPELKWNLVLSCDPEILARHASHVFGISITEGLESISKYIHVPIHIPIGFTPKHNDAIKEAIPESTKGSEQALISISKVVGVLPIREVLAAIPQFLLWMTRFLDTSIGDKRTALDQRKCLDYFFLFSLVSIGVPAIIRYLIKDPNLESMLTQLFTGVRKTGMEGNDLMLERFGRNVLDALALRPDLVRASAVLGLNGTTGSSTELSTVLRIIGTYSR